MAAKNESILMGSWSQLPIDVLDNIIRRLELPVDAVSFSAVCKPWRYVALAMHMILYCKLPIYHVLPKKNPLPMLLHPGFEGPNTHRLYSLNEQKVYGRFHLPELSDKWIVGSGAGWLVTIGTADQEVTLLNPLTGNKIPLPHLSTFPYYGWTANDEDRNAYLYLRKVIVCSYQRGFLVVALVSRYKVICFCKIGDSEWTRLEHSPIFVHDIIMHNGKLYAVNRSCLFEIDIGDPEKMTIVAMSEFFPGSGKQFLVNLCGELVLIEKESQVTSEFRVFKLVEDESGYHSMYRAETRMSQEEAGHSWVQLENIGNHMVFIGYNHSLAFDSRVYPGCKGNCIYFADYRRDEYDYLKMRGLNKKLYHDVGVYHMAGQEVKHFKDYSKASSPMNMVWLSPNLSSELEMQMLPQ